MSPQYQGNLFDSSGPVKFAAAISDVGRAVEDLAASFTTLDSTSGVSLKNIQSRMRGIQSGGPNGGQQWSSSGGPAPGSNGGLPGGAPVPTGGDWTFSGQRNQTSSPNGGGGGTVGMPPMTTMPNGGGGMGVRALQSLPMAAGSAASSYFAGQQGNMMQMTAYGSLVAQANGYSRGAQNKFSQVPNGALAQNQQDFAQSSYAAFMVGGINPGDKSTLGQANYKSYQQSSNSLQTMMPGLTATGAVNSLNSLYSSPEQQALLQLGLSPSIIQGVRSNPQSVFLPLLQKITTNHANSITPAILNSIQQAFGPILDQALGQDVGDAFWAWANQYVGYTSSHNGQPPPNLFTPQGQKAVGANDNPMTAKLRAGSAKSVAQSKLNPAQAQVSQAKSKVSGGIWSAAGNLLSKGPLANIAGYGGAAAGVLGGAASLLGGLFGGGSGGLPGGAGGAGGGVGGLGAAGGAASILGGGGGLGVLGVLGGGAAAIGGIGLGLSGLLSKGGGSMAKAIGGFGLLGGAEHVIQGLFGHHASHPTPTKATTEALITQGGISGISSSNIQDIFKISGSNVGGQGGAGALATILGAIGLNALIKGSDQAAMKGVTSVLAGGLQQLSQSVSQSLGGPQSVGGNTINNATLTSARIANPSSLVSGVMGNPQMPNLVPGASNTGTSIGDPTAFANEFLTSLGAPVTAANVASVVAWAKREGGNWNNNAKYNPLNTTFKQPGSTSINSVGVQSYISWDQGIQATVQTLKNGKYSDIIAGLMAGGGLGSGHYPGLSTWSGGGYDHLARGSYNIGATQLALVHAGERIVPAAENYAVSGRYSRGSGGPGGGGDIHLHFAANSIQLNPAASAFSGSGLDMQKAATDFVESLATPAVLTRLRSN